MKLYGSSEMARIDRCAIEELGIPSSLLMENAGRGTVNYIRHHLGLAQNSYAPIFIGPGNNGGDGFVVGRHLFQHGCIPLFVILASKDQLPTDSLLSFSIIEKLGLPYTFVSTNIEGCYQDICAPYRDKNCYALIDALFGVGLCREVRGKYAEAIRLLNREKAAKQAPIISCDIASGISADTGSGMGHWVRADYTATYSFAKPGQLQAAGKEATGKLKIIDIGIPPAISGNTAPLFDIISPSLCADILNNSPRQNASHKGSHGHILIIGASKGMAGAALLTGKASLKMGSGLTTLAVPGSLSSVFEGQLYEAMTIALGTREDEVVQGTQIQQLTKAIDGRDIIAIGPGLGTDISTVSTVQKLYQDCTKPLVVDADAINALVGNQKLLCSPRGVRVFTPHPGEMARLLGTSIVDIQDNRRDAAIRFLNLFQDCEHEVILVLKGEATIVASTRSQILYLNTSGNPGMATGGMGDVLTGIIASLIGQGLNYLNATLVGTYIHGMAADHLVQTNGIGFTASEVAESLPLCRKKLESRTEATR